MMLPALFTIVFYFFRSLSESFLMRNCLCVLLVVCCVVRVAEAQKNTAGTQMPDLKTLPDVTGQLQAQIDSAGGNLLLSMGKRYRITAPLIIDLSKHGAVKVTGAGGATLIMDGPGAAIRFVGSHEGTASPRSFKPATWNERMPIISDIEILGAHPEADGVELRQTVAPIVSRVSVRWCRHGIHLVDRNRNVIVADCHLYENSGVGLFLDNVNLHQINVTNTHVSYNRQGGIVVQNGNVRNLHITGCDIEGNMPGDETPTKTANILIELTEPADGRKGSVAEVSITGCTIQHSANYSPVPGKQAAPGAANIRLAGKASYPINSVTITGNILSDTTNNIVVRHSTDIAITANNFFAPGDKNLVVADSKRVVVTGNTFNPRQHVRPGTIEFQAADDCVLSGNTITRFATDKGGVILRGCSGMLLSALSLTDCGSGIVLTDTSDSTISSCRISRTASERSDVSVDATNKRITFVGNAFSGATTIADSAIQH